ncbi:MAG: methylated-DNA--[protein]-cysteine S-methyltransferase [Anaerolineae bacterium]|nr:methylated-DNA--[protein]-cysteine S-methyltransferase [Anaerolineae bacterium]
MSKVNAPSTLASAVLAQVGLIDQYSSIQTPLGIGFVSWNRQGISALMVLPDAAEFERYFNDRFHRRLVSNDNPDRHFLSRVAAALSGEKLDLAFDLRGLSDFERAVLVKARQIPRGEIRPYSWIAREIENPKAVRAVGSALGHNPIPLLIPCHRVVRSDGKIGNYLFGSESKRAMLELEGVDTQQLEDFADHGVKYYGSDTTNIFCYPTCRHARRVTGKHLVTFSSEEEARAAGYRPCKVCRPA